jgi:hypothetical protein
MMSEGTETTAESVDGKSLTFHFIKSSSFRVVHVSGAYGGVTPMGEIHAAVFNERGPIPRQIKYGVTTDGQLGDIVEIAQREGIIREVEADLVMNIEVARSLAKWLNEKADLAEKLTATSGSPEEGRK